MGQGYTRPKHFSDEQDSEYRMTEEYKNEVSGTDYSQYDEPEYDEPEYEGENYYEGD